MLQESSRCCCGKQEMFKCVKCCPKMMEEKKPMMAKCECKYDVKMPIQEYKEKQCPHMCD